MKEPKKMPAKVHTFTGKWVEPLRLKPEDICIEDIAHHLSNQCRWTGATVDFYSVAQHCVLASRRVPKEDAYDALMHDSPEYIIQDMSKPLKNHEELGHGYRQVEAAIERVIGPTFGVRFPIPPSVHEADLRLLITESRDLMNGTRLEWGYYQDIEPYEFTIKAWTPKRAEREFLKRYAQLTAKLEMKEAA